MQYLLLIYEAEEIWENKSLEEKRAVLADHGKLAENMVGAEVEFSGQALRSTSTAVSLRNRAGELQVTDGPFAETKEQLGGFYMIEAKDIDEALKWAAKMPNIPRGGSVEVRPIMEFDI